MDLDRNLLAAALPGYEIGDEIGRGGWGMVVRARHLALGRDVAVKQLPGDFAGDQSALDRFTSEARIIGQLDHPHIVKVYDFVEYQGTWLIVMELLGGGTLWERFAQTGIRADQACAVALSMCAALEVAHRRGILHRDLKPENILFTTDGVARLGDFGIAKELDVDLRRTRAGEVIGTPTYMSPEQALGADVGAASDVYSLAVVLYELLAGRGPFGDAATPVHKLMQHATEAPKPLSETAPQLPAPIAATVMRALEKQPAERFASAEAFGVALARSCRESFGTAWLHNSGVTLMGGGPIEAAALGSGDAAGVATGDHATHAAGAGGPTPPAFVGAGGGPSGGLPGGADSPGGPGGAPFPAGAGADAGGRGGRGVALALVAGLLVIAAIGGVAFVALRNRGETAVVTGASTTTVGPGGTGATTTSAADTTAPPATRPRTCRAGARCIFIDEIVAEAGSYHINWTAVGFEPSYEQGFFHAHFFWDIYSADQAGTNAATFGVEGGAWEITDQTHFETKGELLVSNRPAPANQICVTVGNFAHAVHDPRQFDCVLIPDA